MDNELIKTVEQVTCIGSITLEIFLMLFLISSANGSFRCWPNKKFSGYSDPTSCRGKHGEKNAASWLNGKTAMLLRVCMITVVGFLIGLAGFSAAAQSNLSLRIERDIEKLVDPDPRKRQEAAMDLGQIGAAAAPAVPALAAALADQDPRVWSQAAVALGRIGPAAEPAVPALIEALADPNLDVRQVVTTALGQIGPVAAPAVPALTAALADQHPRARQAVANALGGIGPAAKAAVPALIRALKDQDLDVRHVAAWSLGEIGPAAAPAVPALTAALADQHPRARQAAAIALGRIGPAAKPAVPALIKALADADIRKEVAKTLGLIATSLNDANDIGALDVLGEAQTALADYTDLSVKEHADEVRRAVETLNLKWWEKIRKDVVSRVEKHPYAIFVIAVVPIWLVICFGLFWLSPISIIKINDIIRPFSFKLPDWLSGMTVSLRHLFLVGALNNRPRVLDAWVARHVGKARDNFERKRTVKERSVHVHVPVHLDNETISELKGQNLRAVFGTGTGRLLIWGEGGAGKTSIACRIARWAMADVPEQRPAPHCMLPVLIERELDFEVGEKKDPFTETVRGDLETLIEAQVGEELLAALLKQRRVLVIVDHLSEMTETTRKRVRPDVPNFPAAALVVTSRLEERLGDVPKTSLKPLRVTGDYLSEFMGAYLRAREVRELFPDREFFQAGARIAELVGERDVTVLLVKLYLDRLITTKEKGGDIDKEMPGSIPSLMLQYLNDINRAVPEDARRDERAVHRDAKTLAWTCLQERFRPAPARIDEAAAPALAAVNPEGVKERLDYLERRLRLIETVEPERDRVRFTLDPVAEYLAGLHAVERYQADDEAWRGFLAQTDAMSGGLEVVRGFLLAVRDCCLAKDGEVGVPEFVPDELAERAGLDLERLRHAHLQERIARYMRQLKANDPDDRRVAVVALGEIRPAAEPVVAALTVALADPDQQVRRAAATALGEIGPAAVLTVPALTAMFEDPDVRQEAAMALGRIGPTAVAALATVLANPDPDVRRAVAITIKQIAGRQIAGRSAAEPAVPALVEVLANSDPDVRQAAATALGGIRPTAEPAMAALTAALADPNPTVRRAAATALGGIRPTAEPAVPALVEVLADPNPAVRRAAAVALGRIGPAAEPAVAALTVALADPDPAVCQVVAVALERIGPTAEQMMTR